MTRDETRFSPNVGSLYSFVETSGWTVNATNCSYYVSGGITSGYNWSFTGYSQLQWWENGTWHDLASEKSGTYSGYGDKVYDSMYDYFNRQYVNRTVRVGNYAHAYVNGQSTSATAYIEYIVPALPPNATTVTATRNSNTSVTLAWTEASGVKESVRIERSIDGSYFAEIAAVSGSATSYTDNTTAADHTYTYRIRYYNQNAYGGYSSTSSVTMAPSAPTKITVARATSTNVNVTLTNPSSVATSIQWQVTYDGGSTWSASTSVSGSPVTSFVASTNGGTVKIRVRNVNDTGSSAWIVSDSVVTLVPPAPPTAIEQSGIVNLAYGTLHFRWKHNPLDGSAQTEAHLHYTAGNQTMDIPISGATNEYTVDVHNQAPNSSFSWKVRTKGADPSYSDWSSTLSGKLYAKPQIYFIAQNPPSTVTALPIPIELGYSDPQNMACASAVMTVKRNGRTVYTEPLTIGSSRLTGQITAAELLPEQGATYTVSVTARSGSTLEATTNTTFKVDYVEPTHGTLQFQNEPETGYVSLLAQYDNHGSDVSYTGNTNELITVQSDKLRSLYVQGKAVQDGTPTPSTPVPIQTVQGANICNISAITDGTGVSHTVSGDSVRVYTTSNGTYRGAAVPNSSLVMHAGKSYYGSVHIDYVSGVARVGFRRVSDNVFVGNSTGNITSSGDYTFNLLNYDGTPVYVSLTITWGTSEAGDATFSNLMLNAGTAALPYSPYGSLSIDVVGNNMVNPALAGATANTSFVRDGGSVRVYTTAAGTYRGVGMEVHLEAGKSYYGSVHVEYTTGTVFVGFRRVSDNVFVGVQTGSKTASGDYTFSLLNYDGTEVYLSLLVTFGTSENGEATFSDIMVNAGSAVLPYTQYCTGSTEIPLGGRVLASLPNGVKDELNADEAGNVTLTKRVGVMTLNGSETWYDVGSNMPRFSCTFTSAGYAAASGAIDTTNNNAALCDKLKLLASGATGQTGADGFTFSNGSTILVAVKSAASSVTSAAAFKTWLASNPLRVYYELATPQTIDLGAIAMPKLADGATAEIVSAIATPVSFVGYNGLADAESISVIRVNKDGSRTQLADHAANYTAIVDKYAPLNTAYMYEVVTYAASGAYAVEVTPNLLESTRWFAYWGDNNIAWAQWNPSGSYTLARPEKKRVHYAGRKWPVSYDSKAMEQSHSMTWTVVDMDDWQNGFIDLMNDGGRGVYKGCDGWVFHADFDYSATPQYTSITRMGDMSLTISRIDGEQL